MGLFWTTSKVYFFNIVNSNFFMFLILHSDCHMLAGYFRFKDFLHKAVKLYRVNCDDYDYAESCLEYGTIAFTGIKEKSVKSDPVEALKYFEKGCNLGSSENCLNSGMLLVSPILKDTALERDLPKVRQL